MSRKVTFEIVATVTVNVDDDVDMDELELELYSENSAVDVEDMDITKLEITDSR